MRVSTLQMHTTMTSSMQQTTNNVNNTLLQMVSGKKILKPSDDPLASLQIMGMNDDLAKLDQYQKNITAVQLSLSAEETVLNDTTDTLQRLRDLTLSAGNDGMTQEDLDAIAQEVDHLIEQLADMANTQSAGGEYLFGGTKGDTAPVIKDASGNWVYVGGDSSREIPISDNRTIAQGDTAGDIFFSVENSNGVWAEPADGNGGDGRIGTGKISDAALFEANAPLEIVFDDPASTFSVMNKDGDPIATGLPYAEGETVEVGGVSIELYGQPAAGDSFTIEATDEKDIFSSLDRLSDALKSGDSAYLNDVLGVSLDNIDGAMNSVGSALTSVGTRMNTLEMAQSANEESVTMTKSMKGSLENIDFAEAVTQLTMEFTALQATQQSYAKVNKLSLFNYI